MIPADQLNLEEVNYPNVNHLNVNHPNVNHPNKESSDMEHTSDVERSPAQLRRSTDDRILAGVCAGIARYAGVDPTLVRIAAVVGLVLGFGSIGLVYLLLWAIVPEDT